MKSTLEQALHKGVAAHKEGKLQDAERFYRSILQAQPNHPDANHNLGILAVAVGKPLEAIPFFELALNANPKIEQFWLSYIDVLMMLERFDEAQRVLVEGGKSIISSEKLDALNRRFQGNVSNQLNRVAKGQALSEKSKKPAKKKKGVKRAAPGLSHSAKPSQDQINRLLADYQAGRLKEAGPLAISLTKQFPRHPLAWKVLGAILKRMGRLVESLLPAQKAAELAPQDAEAHSNLGVTLRELGNLDEAEASCRQAIKVKPDYAEAHNNLGVTLRDLGRLEEAEASYRQAIAMRPDLAEAHYNLGNALKELGRLEGAEACYDRAIALKPNDAEALYNRSLLLFDKGNYEAALRDADSCDSKKARVLPLTSLYALGRIDEIYKRIEIHSKVDDSDISIAAFAAFISELENKPTKYDFCPNPIAFIHNASLSSHVNDLATYLAEVIEELNEIATVWEPNGTSTLKGFQTPKHMNIFANPGERVNQLKSIIEDELDTYYLKFQSEQCSYIQKFPATYNLFGWAVSLKQQGHQKTHIHPSGWLSGVIYLKTVPSLGKDEGAIEFSLSGKNYSNLKSAKVLYQPAQGDVVFFPSSLHHRTIPFTTDADRVVVSFDLIPEVEKH